MYKFIYIYIIKDVQISFTQIRIHVCINKCVRVYIYTHNQDTDDGTAGNLTSMSVYVRTLKYVHQKPVKVVPTEGSQTVHCQIVQKSPNDYICLLCILHTAHNTPTLCHVGFREPMVAARIYIYTIDISIDIYIHVQTYIYRKVELVVNRSAERMFRQIHRESHHAQDLFTGRNAACTSQSWPHCTIA